MKSTFPTLRTLSIVLCAGFALQAAGAAQGVRAAGSDANSQYQQERAACMKGETNQDRATCLKEAGAARAEAQRGGLTDGKGSLRKNAKDRCNALSGDEKTDCLARMSGEGTVSGSVGGGGMLREKVTIEPAPTPAPK